MLMAMLIVATVIIPMWWLQIKYGDIVLASTEANCANGRAWLDWQIANPGVYCIACSPEGFGLLSAYIRSCEHWYALHPYVKGADKHLQYLYSLLEHDHDNHKKPLRPILTKDSVKAGSFL